MIIIDALYSLPEVFEGKECAKSDLITYKSVNAAEYDEVSDLNVSELTILLCAESDQSSSNKKQISLLVSVLENYIGCTSFSKTGLDNVLAYLRQSPATASTLAAAIEGFAADKFIQKYRKKGFQNMYL